VNAIFNTTGAAKPAPDANTILALCKQLGYDTSGLENMMGMYQGLTNTAAPGSAPTQNNAVSPLDFINSVKKAMDQRLQNVNQPNNISPEEELQHLNNQLQNYNAPFSDALNRAIVALKSKKAGRQYFDRDFASLGELMADFVIIMERAQNITAEISKNNAYALKNSENLSVVPNDPNMYADQTKTDKVEENIKK